MPEGVLYFFFPRRANAQTVPSSKAEYETVIGELRQRLEHLRIFLEAILR